MISKNILLEKLTPYRGNKKVIVETQSTNDIVNGIMQHHQQYASEYDKIYKYFVGDNVEDTCRNVFDFIKQNIPYKIEPDKSQMLRSPAAILVSNNDCKCYSLFTNGILDAYRRNTGKNFDLYYRFAGYNGKNIEHVFSFLTNGKKDLWIDAVLPTFDNRKQPTFISDKKIKPMALISVSGFPQKKQSNLPPYIFVGKRYESVGNCGCGRVSTKRKRIGADDASGEDDWLKNLDWESLFRWIGNLFSYKSDGEKRKEVFDAKGASVDSIANYYATHFKDFGFESEWNLNEFQELYGFKAPAQGHGWTDRTNEIYTTTAKNFNSVLDKAFSRTGIAALNTFKIDTTKTKAGSPPKEPSGGGGTPSTKKSAILPLGIAISLLTLLK